MSAVNTKILAIIDDDRHLRESLQDLLETEGVKSNLYGSAEEFLAGNGHELVHCILADVRMTGMSGIELLRILRQKDGCPPILIMTSYTDNGMQATALRCGASAFLAKPIDSRQLMACIEKATS
ncbi:response regulator transcription factor [Phyllobacterium bourgognense]|uniref:Response regulator receiver domain-containing protein n=1 Tax=Phyllobacterium bourgognense TaxID=314236 RepID=A0A368YNY8_9HYPH|nr:response regulator [Phyllobacterium bourgognense]RCW81905.1 response regulator receiver domain-containing protein [Phyllobacterium bourgognense]